MSLEASSPSPARRTSTDFATAVNFTRLVWTSDYDAAGGLVADNSPAARYIAHQNASAQVDELEGQTEATDQSDITVDGDEATGSVRIDDASGDKPVTYTWKDFKYENGKVVAWTGKSGPVDAVLWHSNASAVSHGATVKLVSAYVTNAGGLVVVVELTSKDRAARIDDAVYTPPNGYRQKDSELLDNKVDKGEKTLTRFRFAKGPLGGKLRLELGRIDPDDSSSSYSMGTVSIAIK